jgi:hypothetical protein
MGGSYFIGRYFPTRQLLHFPPHPPIRQLPSAIVRNRDCGLAVLRTVEFEGSCRQGIAGWIGGVDAGEARGAELAGKMTRVYSHESATAR